MRELWRDQLVKCIAKSRLRGHQNILKRILLHAAALNLGLFMRTLFGVGTPRSLQGRVAAMMRFTLRLLSLNVNVEISLTVAGQKA